jgi:site-specific recombinase XerD
MKGVYDRPYGRVAVVKVAGVRRERTFPRGTPDGECIEWRLATELELRKLMGDKPSAGTVAHAADRYKASLTGRTAEDAGYWLKPWTDALGKLPLRSVTFDQCRDVLDGLAGKGYSASRINKARTGFLNLWRHAFGENLSCPARRVKRAKEPKGVVRSVRHEFGVDVWTRIFEAMPESKAKAHLMLLRYTSARPSEIARLRPGDIRLQADPPCVWYQTGKGGQDRFVPLTNPRALAAAEMFVRLAAWGPVEGQRKALKAAALAAGIPEDQLILRRRAVDGKLVWKLTPYVGRHECLSELREAGADLADVAAIAGHQSPETTKRYAPVVASKLADVMRKAG